MRAFAALLDGLTFTPGRNDKLRLIEDYLARAPDPDRGWAVAALTGALRLTTAKPSLVRPLLDARVDPELWRWSYDYVGDFAETVSLIWPARPSGANRDLGLAEVVETLEATARAAIPALIEAWLDQMAPPERYALLKLMTGALRTGVSARLAKTAVAGWGRVEIDAVEEVWGALAPPYEALFAWLEGRGPRPDPAQTAHARPVMLAQPLAEGELATLDPARFAAEWKWDGIRVQLVAVGGQRRLYSRAGDEISAAFPEIVEAMTFNGVLDGELLVIRDGQVAPFNDVQQRLNRKTVSARMLTQYPAYIRLYDLLIDEGEDLRPLPFRHRRARLEAWMARAAPMAAADGRRFDLSAIVPFTAWDELEGLWNRSRALGMEGLMLKRSDSAYVAGRPKGLWYKWKRDTLRIDAVVMYAQRGSGKRSSYYSDYTFGAWAEDAGGIDKLVPVGKAYSGFTDAELARLDRWVRANTVNRFGPVREVRPALVVEVEFDSVHRSARHRSGVAMRFPRFHRIRWDKPAEEADRLATLEAMIAPG